MSPIIPIFSKGTGTFLYGICTHRYVYTCAEFNGSMSKSSTHENGTNFPEEEEENVGSFKLAK